MSENPMGHEDSQNLFKRLVECSVDVLSAHRLDGELIFITPSCEELVGYDPEFFKTTDFRTLIHPEDLHLVQGLFRAIPDSPTSISVPFRVRHAKGFLVWIEAVGRLMTVGSSNEQSLIQISCRNVTARKLLKQQRDKMSQLLDVLSTQLQDRVEELRVTEKQLVQAQKLEAIGQLAGGIAHDFNNLLGGMIGFSEAIEVEASAQPSIAEKASRIQQAANRGMDLTKKILSFARINSGKKTSESLNEIVKEARALLERSIPKVVAIDLDLADDLWRTQCDRSEMIQILLNLGINAKDAMPEGGRIRIRTTNFEDGATKRIELEFSDTGVGIPSDIQDRIFEPFFTTKEVGKGTGLGLSVVYGIIQSHQGSIRVSSTSGKGTTFAITLPVLEGEEETHSSSSAPSYSVPVGRHTSSFSGRTALVIDDDDDLRELSEDYLAEVGFNLLSAADGSEAIKLFSENVSRVDLVVLDMNLPEKSGPQVLAEIRNHRPNLPIVIFSGFAKEEALARIRGDAYLCVLEKPCTQVEYLGAVRNALMLSADN